MARQLPHQGPGVRKETFMPENDFLADLLNSSPNEPATKGTLLLVYTDTRSQFRTLSSEMNRKFDKIHTDMSNLMPMVTATASQVATLVELGSETSERLG